MLSESEPVYEGDGTFRVVVPDGVKEQKQSLPGDEETFDAVLTEFTTRIEHELRHVFEFDD